MPTYYNKITVMDGNSAIREIDLSQDTVASAADIMSGKYGHLNTGERVLGTGQGGGTPSATAHTIAFEFTDSTSTTLTGYWDAAFITSAITATTPTEYGGKTVESASLDGVAWYTRPSGTWETLFDGNANLEAEGQYPYFWISDLADVTIPQGSVWRVTFDGTEYVLTATQTIGSYGYCIGNPVYAEGSDDGTPVPLCLYHAPWGAWSGGADASVGNHQLKIERQVSA